MKNLVKVLGIIAVIAIVGLAVSCDVAPEDQVNITINGIPDGANDLYALIVLGDSGKVAAQGNVPTKIKGGSVSMDMVDPKGEAFGKDGAYSIQVSIDTLDAFTAGDERAYHFQIASPKSIKKGSDNIFTADQFVFDIEGSPYWLKGMDDVFPASSSSSSAPEAQEEINTYIYDGEFKANYKLGTTPTDEFVKFTKTHFKIYEAGTNADYLDFEITKPWEYDAVPDATYVDGFKFTGYISAGKPVDAAKNAIYGTKTAPGFTQADITNKTEACMFIYFKADGSFVRTVFSKTSAAAPTKTLIDGDDKVVRNYKKVPK